MCLCSLQAPSGKIGDIYFLDFLKSFIKAALLTAVALSARQLMGNLIFSFAVGRQQKMATSDM